MPVIGRLALLLLFKQAVAFDTQSYDGSGNNLQNPKWGSTGDPFLRLTPAQYGPNQAPNGQNRPNARLVTNILLGQPDVQDVKGASDFLPAWGVVMHLDITFAPKNDSDPFPIPVPKYDPDFDPYGTGNQTIPMGRASYSGVDTIRNSRIITNALTCYIDGSALYGNSIDDMNSIRAYTAGLLKSVQYPTGEFPGRIVGGRMDGYFEYSVANVNISPQTLIPYVLLFREHNRRARLLLSRHPTWSDEQLFQRARRWVISIIQRTTIDFYVPTLTGGPLPPYKGYNPDVNPQIDLFFSQAAFIYGHSGLNEYVLRIDDSGNVIPAGNMLLREGAFKNLCDEVIAYGIEPILRGFVLQPENEIDTKIVDDVRNNLPLNPGTYFDLVSIGIQRGRDLGLPDYNTIRKSFNITPIEKWSDLTNDSNVQNILSNLYSSVNDLDPSVGIFAEDPSNPKSMVGPVTAASIREQFTRLRDGDRFWWQNPGVLTDEDKSDFLSFGIGQLVTLNTQIKYFPDNPFVTLNSSLQYFLGGPSSRLVQNASISSVDVFGMLRLSWNITMADDVIHFRFESNATGWFGFGFGTSMLGADIYFCNDGGNGSFTVQDSWSVAPQPPPSDVSQGGQDSIIYQKDITALQNYSTRVLIFSRKLSTGDPFDTDIVHGPMDIIFAFSQSSELAWHGALNRMHSQINFYESSTAIAPSQTSTVSSSLLILHSISMYVAFIILYPLGIYVARYHRNLNRWLSIHTSLLSSVTSNVVVAALTAIIGTFGNAQSLHYKIGMAVIGLVGISSMAGYFATKLYMAHYRWSNLAAVCRYIHKYSGLLAYIVGLVDCYYGVVELSPTASEQVYYQLIFLVTVFIPPIGLYLYGEKQKHLNIDVKDYMGLNNLPLFRWEDVNHRVSLGAKWIVIDDIIYDIQKYMDFHPGGPYALNQMIGIDAAFAFNGRYTKKPLIEKFGSLGRRGANSDDEEDEKLRQQYVVNNPTTYVDEKLEALIYNHSRYARNILSNYAMGTLRDYDPTPRRSSKDVDDVTNSDSMLKESSLELGTSRVKRIPVHVNTFQHYIIGRKTLLTGPNARHPVYLFRLLFDEEDAEMHSRPGDSYLFQFVDDTGKLVSRSYTPIKVDSKGGIDFMIKLYNGEMTHYLSDAKSVRMRGPIPRTDLLNPFSESGCWKTLGLIAGGTGITPMLLIIDYHLKYCSRDPVTNRPNFHIHLLYANLDEKNIFGVKEIGELEERANGAITVTYIVNGIATEEFDGLVGNITPEVLIATMPKPLAPTKKVWVAPPSGSGPTSTAGSLMRNRIKTPQSYVADDWHSALSKSRTNKQSTALIPVIELGMKETRQIGSGSRSQCSTDSGGISRDTAEVNEGSSMAIAVCGPILMNVTVGDMLRNLGYQNVFTI